MINELISKEDLALFTSAGRIKMGSIYFAEGMKDTLATFEVTIRPDPKRNYFVSAGVHSIIEILKEEKFQKDHINFLKQVYGFSEGYLDYLRNLKFSGEIWALPEGAICFPNEPVLRITAPIIQIVLIEQLVINTVMHQTMLATKLARVKISAKNKQVGTTLVRSHGMESAIKSVRLSRMVGIDISALALTSYISKDLKAEGGVTTHFFMQSFPTELEAFRTYFKHNAERGIILIDTYNLEKGLENFITVAKEFEKQGRKIRGIMLDSGDIIELSKSIRARLDQEGLNYVQILAMGNIDEYKISEIIEKNAPIDIFGVATEVLNCTDSPKLEVVFKMVEIDKDDKPRPIIKLASNKKSYPGKKQVYAFKDNEGIIRARLIGLDKELDQESLLILMVQNGEIIYKFPSLEETKVFFKSQISQYPEEIFDLKKQVNFPVLISKNLQNLFEETKKQMLG